MMPNFLRGDASGDGNVGIDDSIRMLEQLFGDDPPPVCLPAVDANGDGIWDVGDAIYLLEFIMADGLPPGHPFPACGFAPDCPSAACGP